MERCEAYKKLEPQFTLHFNELTEYFSKETALRRGVSGGSKSSASGTSLLTGLGMGPWGDTGFGSGLAPTVPHSLA